MTGRPERSAGSWGHGIGLFEGFAATICGASPGRADRAAGRAAD